MVIPAVSGAPSNILKLQVIGQAVKNLSDTSKSRQPHIAWKQIAGLRDKVIHDYFGVNLDIVWAVIEKDHRSCDVPLTIS